MTPTPAAPITEPAHPLGRQVRLAAFPCLLCDHLPDGQHPAAGRRPVHRLPLPGDRRRGHDDRPAAAPPTGPCAHRRARRGESAESRPYPDLPCAAGSSERSGSIPTHPGHRDRQRHLGARGGHGVAPERFSGVEPAAWLDRRRVGSRTPRHRSGSITVYLTRTDETPQAADLTLTADDHAVQPRALSSSPGEMTIAFTNDEPAFPASTRAWQSDGGR